MRIAITHPYSWPEVRRGGERVLAETARTLANRGHAVTVLTAGTRSSRRTDGGVTTVKYRRLFRDADRHERWFARRVAPALLRGRFDVIHSLMPRDARTAVRLRRWTGAKVVYQEIGNPVRSWWESIPDGPLRFSLVRDADVFAVMSRYGLEVLLADHGRSGTLLPGGVRLSEFDPAPGRAPEPTILFSGSLEEERKGARALLAACALLADTTPDLRVWLSGPGDPAAMLAGIPSSMRDRVEVLPLGEPDEQSARYGQAWVTALPSRGESFGLSVLESLACGTPVVVLDDAATPELVTAETGVVCATTEPEDLAQALQRGLDLARRPGTHDACRRFASGFDWDASVGPVLERVYRQALGSGVVAATDGVLS